MRTQQYLVLPVFHVHPSIPVVGIKSYMLSNSILGDKGPSVESLPYPKVFHCHRVHMFNINQDSFCALAQNICKYQWVAFPLRFLVSVITPERFVSGPTTISPKVKVGFHPLMVRVC